ncbi:FAD-dependent monooxygenase [Streptomyces sp. CoH27]|uniref:FAD-dependent monooxygenase n=1 Tax=Streptomyces sp. CoH27 TaxID=2875763 RepID=UPI001CD1FD96|nr:FAD-dependent monooxygenase [Streptomyces sp. CoH27]
MESKVEVVIAGGGLVGLSLALFLADQGVRTLLVEQRRETSRLPRGRGLNLRSMEVLRAADVEDALRAAPPSVLRDLPEIARARTLVSEELFHAARPAAEAYTAISPTEPLMVDQNEVEAVLRVHAERRGARLRFATRLESFEQDATGVTVRLRGTPAGTAHTVRADYLVAADGHRSAVRAALGIGTSGVGSIAHYANIPFRADLTRPLRGRRLALCYLDEPVAHTMLTRLDHAERWVLMVPYRPEQGESAADFTARRCVELIRAATGVPDLAPELLEDLDTPGATVQTWELASWTADRYREGRVLLTGDAAHVMAPAGGLGGNTGIQDAHNLAWKLAALLRGTGGESLLDTYEQERRPVALSVGEQSVRQQLRRRSGERADGEPAPHPLAAVLGHRYRSHAVPAERDRAEPPLVSMEFTGEPGSRAPHHPLLRDGRRLSTLDLYRTRFVLLCGERGERWADAGRRLGAAAWVRVHRMGAGLRDATDGWAAAHGVSDSGAVLVRPDGFVCWRAADDADPDPVGRLDAVLAQVLGRPSGAGEPRPHGPLSPVSAPYQ